MRTSLVLSALGLAALVVVFGSAAQRQQPAPAPAKPAWQAQIDAMYARGCFYGGMQTVAEAEGGGADLIFFCPEPTPSTLRTNGRL